MAKRVQVEKQASTKTEAPVEEIPKTDDKQELKDEIDDLLDEIDGLLEENAEEFVKNYVQKGGQ